LEGAVGGFTAFRGKFPALSLAKYLQSSREWRPCVAVSYAFLWRTLKQGVQIMASLDWSQCQAVESVPGKRSGAWVFRDTRTPVSVVFDNLEVGASISEIMEWLHWSRD
jgi:hypothetical protein